MIRFLLKGGKIIENLFDPRTTKVGFIFICVALIVFLIMLKVREKKNTEHLIEETRKQKEENKEEKK